MTDLKIEYFGPLRFMKPYETRIDPPVGQACMHCQEEIKKGDIGTMQHVGDELMPLHHECALRGVVGSIGHQMRLCKCYGGSENAELDPPKMTRREAAIAAANYFYSTNC